MYVYYIDSTKGCKFFWKCYVAIPVFNQSRPGQRINSLHVIETDAVYRNPRFGSIPLDTKDGAREREIICFGVFK